MAHVSARAIVIKIGGAAAGDEAATFDFIAERAVRGDALIVVHGGGPLVGEWSKRLGLEPRFQDGLRVTDEPTRDVAFAVLAGLANKRVVAALSGRRVDAVGLSGVDAGLLIVDRAERSLGFVGRARAVRPKVLDTLIEARFVPVVAPLARDASGELVNVNGDEAAGAIAAGIGARLLVFVSDVEGVRDRDGTIISRLDASAVRRLRAEGVVSGGMLPKLDACLAAAAEGCTAAIVRASDGAGLRALVEGRDAGTVIAA